MVALNCYTLNLMYHCVYFILLWSLNYGKFCIQSTLYSDIILFLRQGVTLIYSSLVLYLASFQKAIPSLKYNEILMLLWVRNAQRSWGPLETTMVRNFAFFVVQTNSLCPRNLPESKEMKSVSRGLGLLRGPEDPWRLVTWESSKFLWSRPL